MWKCSLSSINFCSLCTEGTNSEGWKILYKPHARTNSYKQISTSLLHSPISTKEPTKFRGGTGRSYMWCIKLPKL